MAEGYPDWTYAVALLGRDADGNLLLVRLEPTGELITVIKGRDPVTEDLVTVRLDEDGRLSAFIIDSSDAWGKILAVGNAELAARLDSPVSFDRRGQVIYSYDFRYGYGPWSTAGLGLLSAQELDPTVFDHGGYSVKLTGGSDDERYSVMGARFSVLPDTRAGVAVRLSINSVLDYATIVVEYNDGTDLHDARVRFDHANEKLQVYDEDGNWQDVGVSEAPFYASNLFNFVKIVADFATDYYVRLLFNSQEIDLSAYPIRKTASALGETIRPRIYCYSRDGQNNFINVDSVVVTVNEP